MEYPREITAVQTTMILISSIIGPAILSLPLFAVQAADTGAPLLTAAASVIVIMQFWLVAKLGMRFPDQSIILYSEWIIGKWLGRLYSFLVIVIFTIITGLLAREFSSIVVTAVLNETPPEVTSIIMLLMAAIFTRNDFNTFAYIHNFYVPIILVTVISVLLLSLMDGHPLYLQPVFGHIQSEMGHSLLNLVFLFQIGFILTIIIPKMQKPHKAAKAAVWGITITGGLYVMSVIATLAVFGPEELKNLIWPTLELARTTSIPGNLLQRLDVLFISVWVVAVFTTVFSGYMLIVHALSDLFRLSDHRMFSLFLLPIIFVIAMIPKNIIQMYEIFKFIGSVCLFFTIVVPTFLLIIAKVRNRPGNRESDSNVP